MQRGQRLRFCAALAARKLYPRVATLLRERLARSLPGVVVIAGSRPPPLELASAHTPPVRHRSCPT
eukprot:8649167-Alexandrium_andersonii.AAC.1